MRAVCSFFPSLDGAQATSLPGDAQAISRVAFLLLNMFAFAVSRLDAVAAVANPDHLSELGTSSEEAGLGELTSVISQKRQPLRTPCGLKRPIVAWQTGQPNGSVCS